MNNLAQEVAKGLLTVGAVKLSPKEPFTWASGWKSPIYCDNRVTLSYPELRTLIKNGLVSLFETQFKHLGATAIAGVATAGIPQGALLAEALDLPFGYVRPKPKEHGTGSLIEGRFDKKDKIVLVEDLISTGLSSLKAAQALRNEGYEPIGMLAIFSYGFEIASQNFLNANLPLHYLSDYHHLIEVAVSTGIVDSGSLELLKNWRENPDNWG
ncbi:MAG: orotate phosphoribosyltransferase [Cytophagales bacterium]